MADKRYILKKSPQDGLSRLSIDYEKELNETQYAAATALEGPLLVIAGAGSGKTRTLIYRVARMIEAGIAPPSILLLTFTRRAAQEMLRRATILVGNRCEQVTGGTFHSFSNLMLRKYAPVLSMDPRFTILDRTDSEDLINMLRTARGLNHSEKRFPRKKTLAEMFSASVNKSKPLEEIILGSYVHFSEHLGELTSLQAAYRDYKAQKALVDFDDLLVQFRDLLANHGDVSQEISRTYRFIMVDEYQDTNQIQSEIINLMAATHRNVMVVGDDSQSIYSFRGANFWNIMDFPKQFSGTQILTLEENYRSTQPILNLANDVISRAREKYPKHLFTRKQDGPVPVLIQAEDERAQSMFVCQKVLELLEKGVPQQEIAVLFRSSFLSFDLEIELARYGIPYVKRGGFKFMETAHVKDVLAHIRVTVNPRDSVSWNRMLLLMDRVGSRTSQKIIDQIVRSNGRPDESLKGLKHFSKGFPYSAQMQDLCTLLEKLSGGSLSPSEHVAWVSQYYLPHLKRRYDDYPRRLRDLEHLQNLADRYDKLENFLSDLTLEPPNESISDITPPDREEEKLVLSTIHSAKGLEWHTVIVLWSLDGRLPSLYAFDADEEMEEERRLFYVAVTRAKENLFMTYPARIFDRSTGMVLSRPSRFVEGLPEELLETWSLVEEV